MKPFTAIVYIGLIVISITACYPSDRETSLSYRIEKQGERWVLLREDLPFYIKGAVARDHMETIQASGGNSVRIWGHYEEGLNEARRHGLTVLVNLPVKPERNSMNWEDPSKYSTEGNRTVY